VRSDPHGAPSPPPGRSDPLAVVDPALRVRGASGLRVVDASVLPTLPGGQLGATTFALAERAARIILGERAAGEAEAPAERRQEHAHALGAA